MFASKGRTRETRISTPAMGQDKAWRNAAIVTIIAAVFPRSSKGLDDISSTADIVQKSTLLAENGIVTGRGQEEVPFSPDYTPFEAIIRHTKQTQKDPD
jgi:hypothetical protein